MTVVVSPLVALMHDQALELNRSIGGAVRALVAPLRESSSRAGKTEVADQLLGRADHGIRLVYVSPERMCQRRFREVVRQGVACGTVRRIALDEAHTFVQWGDDFRPSFRRVERFLAELRDEFRLPVTALTATANRAVHAGLRQAVFGLSEDPSPDGDGEQLITVQENPIRPELAIFRRTIAEAGPAVTAGLAEEIVDCLGDHAIFYCLTVKEVVRTHAHLREYLGDAGVRILRFHGRLTEAEKSAVMTEFREAPRKGEEGFAPVVVVATSAFGLGINRPDIRTVFCASPPTDLAALYQQLGRAGRDAASRATTGASPGEPGSEPAAGDVTVRANTGLTLRTRRGMRTVEFMTGQDLPVSLLRRMAQAVLCCGGVLDTGLIAERLIGEELQAGRLTRREAGQQRTVEAYSAGVVRALAALAELGAVTDLGDFPPLAAVKPGELAGFRNDPGDPAGAAEREVVAALLGLPARGSGRGQLQRARLDVADADKWLAATVSRYRSLATDPAATWQLLADMHDRGQLDVSAAPSRRLVTGVGVAGAVVPAGFGAAVSGKTARARAEIAQLQDFFADISTCANRKFADYFSVDVPAGCCTTAANRCSSCWDFRADWAPGDKEPPSGKAFLTERPRPAGWRVGAGARARRLDEQVRMLLWAVDRGLSDRDLQLALRGQDAWFYARASRWIRLPSAVVTSRFFGANPSVSLSQIQEALARLTADGRVVGAGRLWRETGNVAREQRRLARRLAASGSRQMTEMQTREPVWRPYEDDPLFVPQILLGFDALEPDDADRLRRYLAALVAQRRIVHAAIAFNAIYFGYDLGFGGYVGGPVEFDRFEQVAFGETTAALPVGAMVTVAAGGNPLYAEVVYKEGAHPELCDDGAVPAWLSGAPARAGASEDGTGSGAGTVLAERLVIDCDAFGKSLVTSQAQWDRLRRRGKWLDGSGHLLLDAHYESGDDAETDDTEFYARYLLSRGRGQLLAGPLPLVLSEEAGEDQLAAALRSALHTIEDALRSISTLRMWRGYAFSRSSLADRLASRGTLGRDDLTTLAVAASRAGSAAHRRFAEPASSVRYTAIGPLLGTVNGAARQLVGLDYPVAVCHANAVFGDYATREADDGVLPSGAHLRLDDAWQGGGIWRASAPPGSYAHLDPLVPLGLGWTESQPPPAPEVEQAAELPSHGPVWRNRNARRVRRHRHPAVGDGQPHLLDRPAPPRAHPERRRGTAGPGRGGVRRGAAGRIRATATGHPRRIRAQPRGSGPGHPRHAGRRANAADGHRVATGILPRDRAHLRMAARGGCAAGTQHAPGCTVTIDGVEYEHRYDAGILTRDTAPGCARRNDSRGQEPLTLRERILRAVRRVGHLDPNGVAVLRADMVADIVYGPGAGPAAAAALHPVIDSMVNDGTLTVEKASFGENGLQWPAEADGEQVPGAGLAAEACRRPAKARRHPTGPVGVCDGVLRRPLPA